MNMYSISVIEKIHFHDVKDTYIKASKNLENSDKRVRQQEQSGKM